MTRDRGLGPLGKRLLVAFLLVVVASVGTLSAAALIGTKQGINAQELAKRQSTADSIAKSIADAYSASGRDWTTTNMAKADNIAEGAGLRFIVRDLEGATIAGWHAGNGMTLGMMGMMQSTSSGRWVVADVIVDGSGVATVSVWFPTVIDTTAQTIAWTWIGAAAAVSLLVAVLLAWFVSRRIAHPLLRISHAARRFADGDRSARTDPRDARAGWELGELARAFDSTADNVVRSENARRHIAADVAHELRTPLTVLQAGLEELRDGLVPADTEHLATLHAQARRLTRIVEDLSSLQAAETAALSLRPTDIDLSDVARAAYREAAASLATSGLHGTIHADAPAPVHADADRLHQAIANLLSNATRYCRPGDDVDVSVHVADGAAVLEVADSGPGVPDSELPHLFERLWRGSNSSGSSGSGIGLAVARELIEAQRGTITATRNARGGLTVRVMLPSA